MNELITKIVESSMNGEISKEMRNEMLDILEEHAHNEQIISDLSGENFTEAYIGSTPVLKEAESVLDQLLTEMRSDPLKDYDNHPLTKKFTDLIQKQFGFKKVLLGFVRTSEAMPNIYTLMSVDVIIHGTVDPYVVDKKRGYYDGKHAHTCYIQASSTLPSQMNITAREYMAVLLHEIGHNFDCTMYSVLSMIVSTISLASKLILTTKIVDPNTGEAIGEIQRLNASVINVFFTMTGPGKQFIGIINSLYEKVLDILPILKKLAKVLRLISDKIIRGIELIAAPATLTLMPLVVLLSPLAQIENVFTRKKEEFADSFASLYGYGPDLATVLQKLDHTNLKDYSNPILHICYDMALTCRYIVTFAMADNGTTLDRLNSTIGYLKREIASSEILPEVKSELLQQVSELEKTQDNILEAKSDEGKKAALTAFTIGTLNELFNGRSDYIAKLLGTNIVE